MAGSGGTAGMGGTGGAPGPIGSEKGLLCNREHFCWENPRPQGNTVNAVWASSTTDVWFAGRAGTLFHFDGTNWSNQAALDAPALVDDSVVFSGVWGSAPNDVWFVGERQPTTATSSVILHWNGTRLNEATHPSSAGIRSITGSARNNVWAASTSIGNNLLRFDGTSWQSAACDSCGARDVVSFGPNDTWAVGFSGIIRRWNGSQWQRPPGAVSGDFEAAWGSGPDDVWAVGWSGAAAHWNGVEFRNVNSATRVDLLGVWSSGPNDAWAVGRDGTMVHSTGGDFNVTRPTSGYYDLTAVFGTGASDVWAVGDAGLLLRKGSSWSQVSTGPIPTMVHVVRGTGPADVWFGTSEGLWHWNESATFAAVPDGPDFYVRGLLPLTPAELWVVGDYSMFLEDDTWTATASANFSCIWGTRLGDVWGDGYGSLRHFDGQNWTVEQSSGGYAMDGTGDDDIWVVGSGGLVMHYDGDEWTQADSGTQQYLWGVSALNRNEAWAVGTGGTAIRFLAGEWNPVPIPKIERFQEVIALARNDVWTVGVEGGAAHFDGEEWSMVPTGTDLWLNSVWASGPNDIWAVGAYGAILHKRR
jgi:hypothetical protein